MDDVVVKDVEMFRAEQLDTGLLWLCCYLRNGERVTFDVQARCRPRRLEYDVGEVRGRSRRAGRPRMSEYTERQRMIQNAKTALSMASSWPERTGVWKEWALTLASHVLALTEDSVPAGHEDDRA